MTSISYPVIPIKTYRFFFGTAHANQLPDFAGSAWRGAFGHALKQTVCIVRNTACSQCLLKSACAYSYIFETPPPENSQKMRKYNAAPHPFVLRLPQIESSGSYPLDIILFGHGQRYFPYIVHALQTAGAHGIGGQRHPFVLQHIDDVGLLGAGETIYQQGQLQPLQEAEIPEAPDMPVRIEITFHTPLRVKQYNRNLADNDFNFGAFFSTLLRRISMISYFHTDTPLETEFSALTNKAKTISFNSKKLTWYDWTRYSSRQKTEMQMGGLIGSVELDMLGLEEFWPYLWLGQWTHVGKGTSMGMGAYTIKSTSLPISQN